MRARLQGEAGATLVESAIVLGLFIIVMMGVVDFGRVDTRIA